MSKPTRRFAALCVTAAVLFTGLAAQAAHSLPPSYKEVEYLDFTGGAKIDTGVHIEETMELCFKFSMKLAAGYGGALMDYKGESYQATRIIYSGGSTTDYLVHFMNLSGGGGTTMKLTTGDGLDKPIEGVLRKNYAKINGVENKNLVFGSGTANPNNLRFQDTGAGSRFYYLTISNSADDVVHDFVPCVNTATGAVGLWNGTELLTSTDGAVTPGPWVVDWATTFYIAGEPKEYRSEAVPVTYGPVDVEAGSVISAPAAVPFNNGNYVCTGYKLYSYDDGAYTQIGEDTANTYTVQAADVGAGRKLVWQWETQYWYDAHSYVQRNLIAQFDGIDNQGTGVHDPNATTWVDLTGNCDNLSSDGLIFKDGNSVYLESKSMTTTCSKIPLEYDEVNGRSTIEVVGCMPVFTASGDANPRLLQMGSVGSIGWHSASRTTCRLTYRGNATTTYFYNFNASASSADTQARDAFVEMTRTLCQDGKYGFSFYANGTKRTGATYIWQSAASPSQSIVIGNTTAGFASQLKSARVYTDQLTDQEIAYNAIVDQVRFFGADAATAFDELGIRARMDGVLEYRLAVDAGDDGQVQVTTNGVTLAAADAAVVWLAEGETVSIEYLPNEAEDWRLLSGAPAGAAYPTPSVVAFAMVPAKTAIAAVPYTYSDENVFSTVAPASVVTNYGALVVYSYATPTAEFAVFTKGPITLEERDGSYHALARNESFTITPSGPTTVLFSVGNNASRRFSFDPFDAYPIISGMATPEPAISLNDVALTKGVDYDLYYENATVPGAATMVIVGKAGTAVAGLAQRYGFTAETVCHVTPEGDGDGSDWAHAANFTNAVTVLAGSVHEIWCKAGTYDLSILTNALALTKQVAIRGGYAGDVANPLAMDSTGAKSVFDGGGMAPGAIADTYEGSSGTFATKKTEIVNCVFTRFTRRAYDKPGASSIAFENCDFLNNTATNVVENRVDGGCVFCYKNEKNTPGASLVFKDCRFEGNIRPSRIDFEEMPIFVNRAKVTLESCLFITNGYATANSRQYRFNHDSGDIIMLENCSEVTLRNCQFLANMLKTCTSSMRGIYCTGACAFTAENCAFVGNQAYNSWKSSDATGEGENPGILVLNCSGTRPVVRNCTFAYNLVDDYNASVLRSTSAVTVENCIFWNNRAVATDICSKDAQVASGSTFRYTLCDSAEAGASFNIAPGEGTVVEDPQFASETTMDEIIGTYGTRIYLMYDNPETLAKIMALDVHLKSPAGYRKNGDDSWYGDEETPLSPAVDKGNPASAWDDEPDPNGSRVNIGAYGNTAEASKTPVSLPALGDPVVTFEGPYTQPTVTLTMGGEGAFSVDVTVFASSNGTDWVSVTRAMKKGESYGWLVPIYFPENGKVYVKTSYTHQGQTKDASYEPTDVEDGKVLPPWAGKGGDPKRIIHLRADATGRNDGTSWTDAFTKLGDALRAITATKCEIWIAGTNLVGDVDNKTEFTFACATYFRGGFDGHENTIDERTPGVTSVLDGQNIANILQSKPYGYVTGKGWVAFPITFDSLEFRRAWEYAVKLNLPQTVLITNCVFTANAGRELDASGRILNILGVDIAANIKIVDTVFKENILTNAADYTKPGQLLYFQRGRFALDNCLFVSNGVQFVTGVAPGVGCSGTSLLMCLEGAHLSATGCRFIANRRRQWWKPNTGGHIGSFINVQSGTGLTFCFTNCLVMANEVVSGWAYDGGEAFFYVSAMNSPTVDVVNCTFAYNVSQHSGTASWTCSGMGIRMAGSWTAPRLFVRNTIFHGNRMTTPITYREIDVNSYDDSMHYKDAVQISYSSFDTTNAINSVCGLTNAVREGVIFGDAKLVTTTNDFAQLLSPSMTAFDWNNKAAEIMALNAHLQGRGGYIDETTGKKVAGSGKPSPCVDAGDPAMPYKGETKPNGRRVNMGFYGNTPYQTQSGGVSALIIR